MGGRITQSGEIKHLLVTDLNQDGTIETTNSPGSQNSFIDDMKTRSRTFQRKFQLEFGPTDPTFRGGKLVASKNWVS